MTRSGALALAAALLLAVAAPSLAGEPTFASSWGELLAAHTRRVERAAGTVVDYRALARDPAARRWHRLLAELAATPEPDDRDERLAFWINAYNILAIDTVVRSHPIRSIRDAGSFLRPVWKREAGVAGGRSVTLDEIEHAILRPIGEPRIHAAIVCASTSCPSLRRTPFTAAGLDAELDDAMARFLASPEKGLRIDRIDSRITLSRIFDWFEEDFEARGGVLAVVTRHAPEADRDWLARNGARAELDWFDYDWSLNEWIPGEPTLYALPRATGP